MASSLATICLLTQGTNLASFRRSLESIVAHTPGTDYELRLGFSRAAASLHYAMGHLCTDGESIVRDSLPGGIERFGWNGAGGLVVHAYESSASLAKETMVRLLYHDVPSAGEYTIWFDDDAYVTPGWWEGLTPLMERKIDYFGQAKWVPYTPAQIAMIQAQPWYTGVPFLKRHDQIGGQFMTGFVAIRTQRLREVPVPECGNAWKAERSACDILFGEITRQMRWSQAAHHTNIGFGSKKQENPPAHVNGRAMESVA